MSENNNNIFVTYNKYNIDTIDFSCLFILLNSIYINFVYLTKHHIFVYYNIDLYYVGISNIQYFYLLSIYLILGLIYLSTIFIGMSTILKIDLTIYYVNEHYL